MRIAYVSTDWSRGPRPVPGGSGWARVHLPARELEARGHTVVVGGGIASRPDGLLVPLSHDNDKLLMHDPEIVVIQRWMNAEGAQAQRAARAAGQVVIHDIDDWFWGLDTRNRAYAGTSKRNDRQHNRQHYGANVAAADAITVSSEFLARRVQERFGVRTILLRNTVDLPAFPTQPIRTRDHGLTVGWVGALGWRSGDLETLQGILDPWLEKTESVFVHHGVFPGETDSAAEWLGVAPDRALPPKPGCSPYDYPELVAGFDIGIVPLSEQPFNHAKSWIKGLEYAAAGIPFVAQRTREYEQLGAGLLARTPREWTAALDRLRDPAFRAREKERGLAIALKHRTSVRASEWEQTYERLLSVKAPTAARA